MFNNTQDKKKKIPILSQFLTYVERMYEISSQWETEIDFFFF